jgi:hypothetical protein
MLRYLCQDRAYDISTSGPDRGLFAKAFRDKYLSVIGCVLHHDIMTSSRNSLIMHHGLWTPVERVKRIQGVHNINSTTSLANRLPLSS